MTGAVIAIPWDRINQSLPAYVMISVTAFTGSVSHGLISGFVVYIILNIPFLIARGTKWPFLLDRLAYSDEEMAHSPLNRRTAAEKSIESRFSLHHPSSSEDQPFGRPIETERERDGALVDGASGRARAAVKILFDLSGSADKIRSTAMAVKDGRIEELITDLCSTTQDSDYHRLQSSTTCPPIESSGSRPTTSSPGDPPSPVSRPSQATNFSPQTQGDGDVAAAVSVSPHLASVSVSPQSHLTLTSASAAASTTQRHGEVGSWTSAMGIETRPTARLLRGDNDTDQTWQRGLDSDTDSLDHTVTVRVGPPPSATPRVAPVTIPLSNSSDYSESVSHDRSGRSSKVTTPRGVERKRPSGSATGWI